MKAASTALHRRRVAAFAVSACMLAGIAQAQALSASSPTPPDDGSAQADAPLPVTVAVDLPFVVILVRGKNRGAPYVRFHGGTAPFGGKPVHYSVEGFPAPMSGTLPIDEAGRYKSKGFAPLESGDYTLTVTAPDGRGKASLTVRAFELEQIEDELVEALDKAADAAGRALAAASPKIDPLPHSPVKEPARQKIAAARAAVRELSGIGGSVRGLIGAIGSSKGVAERAAGPVQAMATQMAELQRHTRHVQELTARMSSADVGCHQLVFVGEFFKVVSALLNVERDLMKVAVSLAKDVVSDAASSAAKDKGASNAAGFGAGQAVKNAPQLLARTNRFAELAGNAKGILADVGSFMAEMAFGAYCEQFVGPVAATMTARFDDPELWWSYSYKITARLVLYYPKSAKGDDSIRLNGRLEGVAHDFETQDRALTVLYPSLMASALQVRKDIPPVDIGAAAAAMAAQGFGSSSGYVEGSVAGAALPNSFAISVTGVLEKDSITLLLGNSFSDFRAAHRVVAVVASPLALLYGLTPISYALPFKNAHHVFLRASQGQAMRLELKTGASTMTAQGRFSTKRGSAGAHGQYEAAFKVCNPSCGPAPPDAPKKRTTM